MKNYLNKSAFKVHPGRQMPNWDEMRKWAFPVFENADDYTPQNTNNVNGGNRL